MASASQANLDQVVVVLRILLQEVMSTSSPLKETEEGDLDLEIIWDQDRPKQAKGEGEVEG